MPPSHSAPQIPAATVPEPVVQAAIDWAIRLQYNQASDRQRTSFNQWLQAHELHRIAWERVSGMHGLREPLAGLPPVLVRDTLETVQQQREQQHNSRRRQVLKMLSLSSLAVGSAWLAKQHTPWQRVLADASTGIGEQQQLRLDDGTALTLNTDSAISLDFNATERLIRLYRGEILIRTGADGAPATQRPFWVETPQGRLQALGTRFTVRLDEAQARARVSVQAGAVALHPAQSPATAAQTAAIVEPGQSRWLYRDGSEPAGPLPFAADDWAQGVIAGQNMRIGDLLAEVARYRHGRIVCDPAVADLRVSGLFHTQDTDKALQFLEQTQPIRLVWRTRWWVQVVPA